LYFFIYQRGKGFTQTSEVFYVFLKTSVGNGPRRDRFTWRRV